MKPILSPPDWVRDAVFYQIFPDRFAKSEEVSKPANLEAWSDPPTAYGFKGGDLLGIVEHLDYLVDLGVNALYLNPIFQSACNHRYHTHDYFRVDPLLGGDAALRHLVKAAHDRGIKIVLDGVFNHASRGFFQFNDILENGPKSPWLDWFVVEDWPLAPYDGARPANYASWWNNRALPKFNTDNPQVREFLMTVAEYWIREFDVDGWRLDVPEEITTTGFWEEFRRRVKRVRGDAYIVGEIWGEAPDWLNGERFDASMNYQLAAAVIAFSAGHRVDPRLIEGRAYSPYPAIDAAEFAARVRRMLSFYSWETNLAQFNLLGSHDTARLIALAGGDASAVKLATLLQITLPGAPCIYYGDEIGLAGSLAPHQAYRDSDARRSFPWQKKELWNKDLLAYFRKIIALRHKHHALREGAYQELAATESCYAFARVAARDTIIVAANAGETTAQVILPLHDLVSGTGRLVSLLDPSVAADVIDGVCELNVPPRHGVVLGSA
jgi:glycosidase